MFVLDTNVLSEMRPGKPGQSAAVRAWASVVPESQFYLSAITVLECEIGVLQLERRTPPQGARLRAWWEAAREAFDCRLLPFTAEAAMRRATMHVPDPQDWRDSMIAATVLAHGFTLVTRNVSHFAGTGVKLLNPWDPT